MKRGAKRIKKSEETKQGVLSYEIINNTEPIVLAPPTPVINQDIQPTQQTPIQQPVEAQASAKKNHLKTLVTLIIILIIIDLIFLFWYFKPDMKTTLSNIFKAKVVADTPSKNQKCSDGTAYGSCSKNKPYYCYNGELIKKAATCGCP